MTADELIVKGFELIEAVKKEPDTDEEIASLYKDIDDYSRTLIAMDQAKQIDCQDYRRCEYLFVLMIARFKSIASITNIRKKYFGEIIRAKRFEERKCTETKTEK